MLRRNVFPLQVDKLPKLDLLNASRTHSIDELTFKTDRRAMFLTLVQGETVFTEPTSPVTSSPNLGLLPENVCAILREPRVYDEGKEERKEMYDVVYVSEEERTNSSDVNLEEKDELFAELVHSQKHLKKLNADLQKSLDMSDECNMSLRAENTNLKNENQGWKQSFQDAQQLREELENLHTEKLEREGLLSTSEAKCKQLQKQNETLKDQMVVLSSEMSSILSENDMHKRQISELSKFLKALQQQVEEYSLHLKQKDELTDQRDFVIKQLECSVSEYSTIIQDLKEKIKDLECQLSWALVNGGEGSFVYLDGTLSVATQRSVSLGEELGLLPGGQCHSGRVKEDEIYEEEDGWENEQSKDDLKTEKQGSIAKPIEKEASQLQAPMRWLKKSSGNLKRRLSVAGMMGLGCVVLLGLLSVMMSTFYEVAGLSCADHICGNTAHDHIKPYCSIHHSVPPPV